MSTPALGSPLTGEFEVSSGQARVFERGVTLDRGRGANDLS